MGVNVSVFRFSSKEEAMAQLRKYGKVIITYDIGAEHKEWESMEGLVKDELSSNMWELVIIPEKAILIIHWEMY